MVGRYATATSVVSGQGARLTSGQSILVHDLLFVCLVVCWFVSCYSLFSWLLLLLSDPQCAGGDHKSLFMWRLCRLVPHLTFSALTVPGGRSLSVAVFSPAIYCKVLMFLCQSIVLVYCKDRTARQKSMSLSVFCCLFRANRLLDCLTPCRHVHSLKDTIRASSVQSGGWPE